MESNGGQQRCSTESTVAQEGTQSGGIKRGRKGTSIKESAGDVPKKVKKIERIFVKTSRTYSGEKVMEMLNKLRHKLTVERNRSRSLLKTNKNMRARNMEKMQKHIKKASILKLRNNGLAKNYRVMMTKWEEKLKKEKDKREKFQKEEIKKFPRRASGFFAPANLGRQLG